jgi:hypothetical protein
MEGVGVYGSKVVTITGTVDPYVISDLKSATEFDTFVLRASIVHPPGNKYIVRPTRFPEGMSQWSVATWLHTLDLMIRPGTAHGNEYVLPRTSIGIRPIYYVQGVVKSTLQAMYKCRERLTTLNHRKVYLKTFEQEGSMTNVRVILRTVPPNYHGVLPLVTPEAIDGWKQVMSGLYQDHLLRFLTNAKLCETTYYLTRPTHGESAYYKYSPDGTDLSAVEKEAEFEEYLESGDDEGALYFAERLSNVSFRHELLQICNKIPLDTRVERTHVSTKVNDDVKRIVDLMNLAKPHSQMHSWNDERSYETAEQIEGYVADQGLNRFKDLIPICFSLVGTLGCETITAPGDGVGIVAMIGDLIGFNTISGDQSSAACKYGLEVFGTNVKCEGWEETLKRDPESPVILSYMHAVAPTLIDHVRIRYPKRPLVVYDDNVGELKNKDLDYWPQAQIFSANVPFTGVRLNLSVYAESRRNAWLRINPDSKYCTYDPEAEAFADFHRMMSAGTNKQLSCVKRSELRTWDEIANTVQLVTDTLYFGHKKYYDVRRGQSFNLNGYNMVNEEASNITVKWGEVLYFPAHWSITGASRIIDVCTSANLTQDSVSYGCIIYHRQTIQVSVPEAVHVEKIRGKPDRTKFVPYEKRYIVVNVMNGYSVGYSA